MFYAHSRKFLRRHPSEEEICAANRAYVGVTGSHEKGTMAFMEYQGHTIFDIMEASL